LLKERSPENFADHSDLERHLKQGQTLEGPEPHVIEKLGLIRNGFLHGNVEFQARVTPHGGSEISNLRVWNCRKHGNRVLKTWEIRFSVAEMHAFLQDFARIMEAVYDERLLRRREDCGFENTLPDAFENV
jgi:hypothetical protein